MMNELFTFQIKNFQLTQTDFFIRMLVSVGIGLLLGLEREHSSKAEKEIFAGVRTFVFVVLLGFLSTLLSLYFTPWILIGALLFTFTMVILSYWVSSNKGEIGGTTEFATLIAFMLGCTTLMGFIEASLAVTVVVLTLLSLKIKIKSLVGQITQNEMYALVKFIILVLLIFPFLPDRDLGVTGIFNPKELGWVIILTSGIGFVGYIFMKFLGSSRGILLTGIIGGLVSSTAVAWIFSKKSKEFPTLTNNCATAILAASTIMVVRVFVWLAIFNVPLIPNLIVPMVLVFLAGIGVSLFYFKKGISLPEDDEAIQLGEPLNLKSAVVFGILYTIILFVVHYANQSFGTMGLYISSAFAAITDIDAITISVSKMASGSIQNKVAQNIILLATLCNTLVKIGISLWNGSKALRKKILFGYGAIFIAGLIGFLILNI